MIYDELDQIKAERETQRDSFFRDYYSTFDIVSADTPELLEEVFKLRYKVYCTENNYINPAFHHGGMECDSYDEHAEHIAMIYKQTGKVIGTARVIFDHEDYDRNFPLQTFCDHPYIHAEENAKRLCQISRFCIDPNFRRREGDGTLLPRYTPPENLTGTKDGKIVHIQRKIPYAPLGLFRAAFEVALSRGVSDCLLNIEKSQLQAFNEMGLTYHTLGPVIYPHGEMQPVVFNIKNLLDTMLIDNPPCWDIISNMGHVHKRANAMHVGDWQEQIIDTLDWNKLLEEH